MTIMKSIYIYTIDNRADPQLSFSFSTMSLASHTLFLATPAQALETQRRRHKFWGGTDMTEEEYIQADNEASSGIALYVW